MNSKQLASPDVVSRRVELPNGVTLDYGDREDAQGAAVVFLHGITDSRHSFKDVVSILPASMRPIALTLRGHGDSSHPETGYRTSDMASDVHLFLDGLGIGSAVIAGHSMGSAVAQRFAIEHPQRTSGLVLMGSFVSLHDNQPVQDLWDVVSQLSDPISRGFIEEFQVSTLARPIPRLFLDMAIDESGKVPARVWKSALAGIREERSIDELHRITAPTLIAWGDRDTIMPARDQQILHDGIRGSRLVIYPGGGHAFHWEEPERFAADLERFVRSL